MTTLIPIIVALPIPPLQVLLPQPARDATTRAVLRYFDAERRADKVEHADAFDHLTAICYRAVRPYFLRDRHGSLTIIEISQSEGGRTTRKEGTAHDATRQWIQEWLLKVLAPYRGKSRQELIAAANNDQFRHLGRLCKLRLKSIVCRKLKREERHPRPPHVSLDTPAGKEGDTLADGIGTGRQDAPSSLATHNSLEDFLACVADAMQIVEANARELARLDLLTGLRAYLVHAGHVSDRRHYDGLVTQTVADLRGVSLQAARAYKKKFRKAILQGMRAGNLEVRDVVAAVTTNAKINLVYLS